MIGICIIVGSSLFKHAVVADADALVLLLSCWPPYVGDAAGNMFMPFICTVLCTVPSCATVMQSPLASKGCPSEDCC